MSSVAVYRLCKDYVLFALQFVFFNYFVCILSICILPLIESKWHTTWKYA